MALYISLLEEIDRQLQKITMQLEVDRSLDLDFEDYLVREKNFLLQQKQSISQRPEFSVQKDGEGESPTLKTQTALAAPTVSDPLRSVQVVPKEFVRNRRTISCNVLRTLPDKIFHRTLHSPVPNSPCASRYSRPDSDCEFFSTEGSETTAVQITLPPLPAKYKKIGRLQVHQSRVFEPDSPAENPFESTLGLLNRNKKVPFAHKHTRSFNFYSQHL